MGVGHMTGEGKATKLSERLAAGASVLTCVFLVLMAAL